MSRIQPRPAGNASVVLCATLLAVVHAGIACTNGTTAPPPGTGLEILVLRGPIEPVEREGEAGENSAPVAEALVVIRAPAGRRITGVTTDMNGQARVALPPGPYTVELERCPGAMFLPEPVTATVDLGAFAGVRLDCDTGIR